MAITRYDHFYEGTMRRFLEQIVRAFSGFQYITGSRNGMPPELRLVPCRMATLDRMVANIQRNLSDNTLLVTPMITIAQTGLSGRRADVQYPGHVDTRQIIEREVENGRYGDGRGNAYTMQRLMPRPFLMSIEVSIWTSNLDQKHQIIEQMCTIFYPTIDIQNSENALDWSALTTMTMEDEITFSSRSIPIGTENEIDVATLQFRVPIWFNPPAQLRAQKIIEQIVMNINDAQVNVDTGELVEIGRVDQVVVIPGDYHIRVEGDTITLLWSGGREVDEMGRKPSWENLFDVYGKLRPTLSRIRLVMGADLETSPMIVGTIQHDSNDPSRLVWQLDPDTLVANSHGPIDAVIDPMRTYPGSGLPNEAVGARYLILSDIGPSQAWGDITARANDIIERTTNGWSVAFSAQSIDSIQHVLNLRTARQLRWTGRDWIMAIDGEYAQGYWRLSL